MFANVTQALADMDYSLGDVITHFPVAFSQWSYVVRFVFLSNSFICRQTSPNFFLPVDYNYFHAEIGPSLSFVWTPSPHVLLWLINLPDAPLTRKLSKLAQPFMQELTYSPSSLYWIDFQNDHVTFWHYSTEPLGAHLNGLRWGTPNTIVRHSISLTYIDGYIYTKQYWIMGICESSVIYLWSSLPNWSRLNDLWSRLCDRCILITLAFNSALIASLTL
jgi:hypothetical protein